MAFELVGVVEHPISLAHARRGADVHTKFGVLVLFQFGEQRFRRWTRSLNHGLVRSKISVQRAEPLTPKLALLALSPKRLPNQKTRDPK
jgi:hypothetical protein